MKLIMNGKECLRWCLNKRGWREFDLAIALGGRFSSKVGHFLNPKLNLLTKHFYNSMVALGYDVVCRDASGNDYDFRSVMGSLFDKQRLDDGITLLSRSKSEIVCIDRYDKRAIDITLEPISKTTKSKIKE